MKSAVERVGVVAIGRNEGERLRRCLTSAARATRRLVYVDSGSRDDSVAVARGLGAEVVILDRAIPFTAARARNAGFERLTALHPEIELCQFVDGDCELAATWLPAALAHLAQHPQAVVVCGRRRERFPQASVYNHLCDLEWDTPVGKTHSSGGDALVRAAAFREVGGFCPDLIAGEEPELCFRLRQWGWEIWRIDAEMTLHDAAMTQFHQWWKRNVRSGHVHAESLSRRGRSPERTGRKQVLSNLFWSMPAAWPLWPLLWWRVFRRRRDVAYATAMVLGKLPHLQGQVQFWMGQLRRRRPTLIEYK